MLWNEEVGCNEAIHLWSVFLIPKKFWKFDQFHYRLWKLPSFRSAQQRCIQLPIYQPQDYIIFGLVKFKELDTKGFKFNVWES